MTGTTTTPVRPRRASARTGALLALALGAAGPAALSAQALSGDELRAVISGNTLNGAYFANQLTIAFYPDGQLVGTLGLSGSDVGKWTIKGDLYCQHWVRYFGAEERCYRWVPDGPGYDVQNADAYRTFGFKGKMSEGFPPGY